MYCKLAYQNVKKSLRDYLLYFLTLTFAVCIFYVFNSIESQSVMMVITDSEREVLKMISKVIGYISVFVSVILGFLIVGANRFLIRRRKKELGIYLLLGMKKFSVAGILMLETLMIGAVSLGAGLLLGIFLSQWLSVLTAKMFEADMNEYTFVFSGNAFAKTILYFGIIFLVVVLAGTIAVSKNKLIDLFSAQRSNEKPIVRNPVLTVILFILSVICLGVAYQQVLHYGISRFDYHLRNEVLLGILGTFLFFASLSGFFLKVMRSFKGYYYKGLNFFILRQINSRINSVHISLSLVCLMLFCTIGILSTGLGINHAINESVKTAIGYDVEVYQEHSETSLSDTIASAGVDLADYTDSNLQITTYQRSDILQSDLITDEIYHTLDKTFYFSDREQPITLISLTDYNNLLKMKHADTITLDENEVAIAYSSYTETVSEVLSDAWIGKADIQLGGQPYSVYPKIMDDTIFMNYGASDFALVVPDSFLKAKDNSLQIGITPKQDILVFDCVGDSETLQDSFTDKIGDKVNIMTANLVRASYNGSTAILSYVGIYLGLIFVLTSAAVLSLQQMSEVSENRQRYLVLKKVGSDPRMINGAIFRQTAIYFLLPLSLATIHSVVGLKVANESIKTLGGVNVAQNIIIAAILILLIYGTYFLATYSSCKQMIIRQEKNG